MEIEDNTSDQILNELSADAWYAKGTWQPQGGKAGCRITIWLFKPTYDEVIAEISSWSGIPENSGFYLIFMIVKQNDEYNEIYHSMKKCGDACTSQYMHEGSQYDHNPVIYEERMKDSTHPTPEEEPIRAERVDGGYKLSKGREVEVEVDGEKVSVKIQQDSLFARYVTLSLEMDSVKAQLLAKFVRK